MAPAWDWVVGGRIHPVVFGWRLVPRGRVAHHLTFSRGDYGRPLFHSACGTTFAINQTTDKPSARRCVKCERALMPKETP